MCYTGCQRKLVASSVCVSSGEWSCRKRDLSEMAGTVENGIGNYESTRSLWSSY